MAEKYLEQNHNISIMQITDTKKIYEILVKFQPLFMPCSCLPLHNLTDYANKLSEKAYFFVALYNDDIIGFTAFYANDFITKTAFISLIGVLPDYQNTKIGQMLLIKTFKSAREFGMTKIKLSVNKKNDKAITFYKNYGFEYLCDENDEAFLMIKDL